MKQKLIEVAKILWEFKGMDEDKIMMIINPLDTIEQAETFKSWLLKQETIDYWCDARIMAKKIASEN